MNHLRDRVPHMADGLCQYVHQFNNKVLICKVRLLALQLLHGVSALHLTIWVTRLVSPEVL